MPIYEFKCNHCGDVFEHLIFSSDGDETACPTCGDEDTCRLMSSFSSISSKFSECPSDGMSAACPPSCSPATSGFSWAWASTAVSCAIWRVSDNEFVKTAGKIHLQPEIFIRNLLEVKRDVLLKFNISINLYKKCFFAYELYIRYGNENSTNPMLKW